MMPRSPVLAESRRSVAYAAMVALAFPPCAAMAKSKPKVITSLPGNFLIIASGGWKLGVGTSIFKHLTVAPKLGRKEKVETNSPACRAVLGAQRAHH